jgi:hypothetical protein
MKGHAIRFTFGRTFGRKHREGDLKCKLRNHRECCTARETKSLDLYALACRQLMYASLLTLNRVEGSTAAAVIDEETAELESPSPSVQEAVESVIMWPLHSHCRARDA